MREVFVSNHLKKEARKNLAICLAWVGFALALLVIGIVRGVTLITVLGASASVVSGLIISRRGPAYATYRCGMQGERVFRDHLRSLALSDEYTAYFNLAVNDNGNSSDIDCILVGPSGVFAFEVKHHHSLIFYRKGVWAQFKVGRQGNLYVGRLGDPSGQLSRNIRRLKGLLLHSESHSLWLHGTIVFTNPRAVLDIQGLRSTKAVAVKHFNLIAPRITVSTWQVDRINACLSALQK